MEDLRLSAFGDGGFSTCELELVELAALALALGRGDFAAALAALGELEVVGAEACASSSLALAELESSVAELVTPSSLEDLCEAPSGMARVASLFERKWPYLRRAEISPKCGPSRREHEKVDPLPSSDVRLPGSK